jgi:hypothetical protein
VADQGPQTGEGGETRQGLYVFTWSGTLLAYRNSFDPTAIKELLAQAWAKWEELSVDERKPKPFKHPSVEPDPRFHRAPPEEGLVLRVHARELDGGGGGSYREAPARDSRPNLASIDHMWLKPEEWKGLIPSQMKVGFRIPVPPSVVRRMVRFHLVDNTRGEPPMWAKEEVRKAQMWITVDKVYKGLFQFKLTGSVHLETKSGDRGFKAELLGYLGYSPITKDIVRFDVTAVGQHWGEGPYSPGARSGKAPLGIAFVLVDEEEEGDKVPPQAARDLQEYYGRD